MIFGPFQHLGVQSAWLGLALCAFSAQSLAQEALLPSPLTATCKVLDPELSSAHYQGPCVGGYAQGEGRVAPSADASASYRGGFLAGRKHGHGRKVFANGDVYEGQWQYDVRTGHGRYVFGAQSPWAADVYEGQWQADKMHGQGTYQWARNESYSGAWQDGRPADEGTGGQARRAAYLSAFMAQLSQTQGQVCALGQSSNDPLRGVAGSVKAVVADRILVAFDKGQAWQLVSNWRPCRSSN